MGEHSDIVKNGPKYFEKKSLNLVPFSAKRSLKIVKGFKAWGHSPIQMKSE